MIAPTEEMNRRILVIDDNPSIHDDFRKILGVDAAPNSAGLDEAEAAFFGEAAKKGSGGQAAGFEIDSAFQGEEGLRLVERALKEGKPYALAFVDVRMPPGWDGIETIDCIWKVDPELQAVLCTAYSDYSWDEMIAKLGQSDRLLILKKPFDNIEVSQLASALAEKWSLARQARVKHDILEQKVSLRTKEIEEQRLELENALERLQESHEQLLQAQKLESIGRLAAGIAHEINTPTQYLGDNTRFLRDSMKELGALLDLYVELATSEVASSSWAETVKRGQRLLRDLDIEFLKEEMPKAIEQSLEGVERVAQIVRSMKEFSHPGGHEKQLIDLNRAIESTITVARNEWKYVAEVVLDLEPTLPQIPCFAGEVNQVILNLVVNAAQAIAEVIDRKANEKGRIRIATRQQGEMAVITIADTGGGIPENLRAKVFDHFFTTKEVGQGTGQGLAIAYSVVTEQHGGDISFESEAGKGTTFTVRLPIVPAGVVAEEEVVSQ